MGSRVESYPFHLGKVEAFDLFIITGLVFPVDSAQAISIPKEINKKSPAVQQSRLLSESGFREQALPLSPDCPDDLHILREPPICYSKSSINLEKTGYFL